MRASLTPSFLFTLILAIIVIFSLVPSFAAADDCVKRNVCDQGFAARAGAAVQDLDGYYGSQHQWLYNVQASVPLRYEVALFELSKGSSLGVEAANLLLSTQFQYDAPGALTPRGALYLAWIEHDYAGKLTGDNPAALAARLDSYSPPGAPEADSFVGKVGGYLANGVGDAGLITLLKAKGGQGWSSEDDPAALADVVEGLAAILATSDNGELATLAEMNLDLVMARFAALDAAGSFGGARAGDTLESGAFNPPAQAWYGWSRLLFDHAGSMRSFTRPGLLLSGYCANDAVRAVLETRLYDDAGGPARNYEVKETFNNRDGRVYSYATPDYVLSGTVDAAGQAFASPEGFVTRAALRFTDDPLAFFTFSTRTSNKSTADSKDAVPDDKGRLYTRKNLVMGRLGDPAGGDAACREPHVFLSTYDQLTEQDGIIAIQQGGHYFLLRFLGGNVVADATGRYRPMTIGIPPVYKSVEPDPELGERGVVVFPYNNTDNAGGVFAFEAVSDTYMNHVQDKIADSGSDVYGLDALSALSILAGRETALAEAGGVITYTSTLSQTYAFDPATGTVTGPSALSFDDYAPRAVHQFIGADGASWTVQGVLRGDRVRTLTLDFSTDTKSASPEATYACEGGAGPPQDEGPGVTDESLLAFLAGSMLQGLDGAAYTLDCGSPELVLPNPLPDQNVIRKACVLKHDAAGETRTLGFLYDTSAAAPLAAILEQLGQYYPFNAGTNPPPATACDDVANTYDDPSGTSFVRCAANPQFGGSYGAGSIWYNPGQAGKGILIISTDSNPFTTGFLDGVFDFFDSLFGGGVAQGVDPALISGFTETYQWSGGGASAKRVVASKRDDEASLLFENLAASVQPLLARFGANAAYHAGGTSQRVSLAGITDDDWRELTARLRLSAEGEPLSFDEVCGNGILEPDATPPEACDDGNLVDGDGCSAECQIETPAVPTCTDDDGDGFFKEGGDCGIEDCFDRNPGLILVNDGSSDLSCDPSVNGDVACDDPIKPWYGACPQCVHYGADEICGDTVDNDCDGVTDPSPPCGTGGGTPPADLFACPEPTACGTVCGIEISPPSCTPCLTDWSAAGTQGHYSFATRINDQGAPELQVTPDNQVNTPDDFNGELCNWYASRSHNTPGQPKIVTGDQTIFDNPAGSSGDHASVDVNTADGAWHVVYNDGGSLVSRACWDVSANPTNPLLSITKPSAGTCDPGCNIVTSGCASNSACAAPTPVCVVTGTTGTCVATSIDLCGGSCKANEACKGGDCIRFNIP